MRNGTADLLKGFAVIFMIQVHVLEQFVLPDVYGSIIGKVSLFFGGPFCAPVFMTIMGYFIANTNHSISYFIKKGIILFALGIALNIGRSANLLIQIYQDVFSFDPYFFVFGADILQLAGISYAVVGCIQKVFKSRVSSYLLSIILVVLLTELIETTNLTGYAAYIQAFLWSNDDWSYFPLFPWIAYVLMGKVFNVIHNDSGLIEKLKPSKLPYYLITLSGVIIFLFPYAIDVTSNLYGKGGYYHHGAVFLIWQTSFLLVYVSCINMFEKFIKENNALKFIKWLGKNVTFIYVIQWLIIGNIATEIYQTQSILQFIFWSMGLLVFCSVLLVIWEKFKLRFTLKFYQ